MVLFSPAQRTTAIPCDFFDLRTDFPFLKGDENITLRILYVTEAWAISYTSTLHKLRPQVIFNSITTIAEYHF